MSIGTLQEAINQGTTLAAEMPTPGNLKSGDTLFCISESMDTMNQGTEKRRDTNLKLLTWTMGILVCLVTDFLWKFEGVYRR